MYRHPRVEKLITFRSSTLLDHLIINISSHIVITTILCKKLATAVIPVAPIKITHNNKSKT